MPCSNVQHRHRPWPTQGTHLLVIEACETQCGWCNHMFGSASNLRGHAHRHIANPKEVALKDIRIVKGKAGRTRVRVAVRSREPASPRPHSHSHSHSPQPRQSAQRQYSEGMSDQAAFLANTHLRARIRLLENLLRENNIQLPDAALSELPLPTTMSLPPPSTAPLRTTSSPPPRPDYFNEHHFGPTAYINHTGLTPGSASSMLPKSRPLGAETESYKWDPYKYLVVPQYGPSTAAQTSPSLSLAFPSDLRQRRGY